MSRSSLNPQLLLVAEALLWWIFCREGRAWLAEFHPLCTSTQGKKSPALKCGSFLQARTEQIPVPQKQHVQKAQRKKELFGYAFISKLNRPQAAGQSTWCACNHMAKLSFSFSLKTLDLSLLSLGVSPWPVSPQNCMLASDGVVIAGRGQNYRSTLTSEQWGRSWTRALGPLTLPLCVANVTAMPWLSVPRLAV